ncbi:MAG: hypothetical protein AAF870_03490 [Pseudomonadota bacterium]
MSINIPDLKRVKISSDQELSTWLHRNSAQQNAVMLVTYTKANPEKHVSHEQVQRALDDYGWTSKMRYTLNKSLVGHAIEKQ